MKAHLITWFSGIEYRYSIGKKDTGCPFTTIHDRPQIAPRGSFHHLLLPQAGFGAHARPNGTTSVNGVSRYDETVETPTKLKTLEDFLQEADEELSLYWVKEGC